LIDVSICLTHDVIYQPAHLIQNVASRELAQERKNLKWLHWIHSATTPHILCNKPEVLNIIKQPFPNAIIAYPNTYDRPRVAANFNWEERLVKYVPHPIDVCEYLGFQDITKRLVNRYDLLNTEILMIYPVRLDRGKQPHILLNFINAFKELGRSAKVIIADFHSDSKDPNDDKFRYRNDMKNIMAKLRLTDFKELWVAVIFSTIERIW